MLPYVFAFLASAAVVVAAGAALTRAADAIAETTGLGRAWIGAVLLAGATSIPEIATYVSAVRMHAPNLAAGGPFRLQSGKHAHPRRHRPAFAEAFCAAPRSKTG